MLSSLTKTKYKRGLQNPNMSRHDDYLHALLQLFHQAVKLDMNPGGERWWIREKKKKKREKRIRLLVVSDNDNSASEHHGSVWVCVCVCEKPGPCIERGLPVGTMDATTPTPSPQPTSQRAFIWACTWVLQPCLAKRVCAPEQGGWVPSQNSPRTLAANPPTFLRQRPAGIKTNTLWTWFFATENNKKKNAVE